MNKITSLRIGMATNSSSTHSVVIFRGGYNIPDVSSYEADMFDCFAGKTNAITSQKNKITMLLASNAIIITPSLAEMLVEMGVVETEDEAFDLDSKADDVMIETPYLRKPEGIEVNDWVRLILSPELQIYSHSDGLDLEDAFPHLADKAQYPNAAFIPEMIMFDGDWTTKKDGDAWVFFHKKYGHKFRWADDSYIKSTTPELVDVKVTDYCDYGCAFCYQGSEDNGLHAPLDRIKSIFQDIAKNGGFEVALGGGEPTKHPDFAEIIRYGVDLGLKVNFTTYGVDWTRDEKIMRALDFANGVGLPSGIGVSVHKPEDVIKLKRIKDILDRAGIYGVDLVAQTVTGVLNDDALFALMDESFKQGFSLLLLGYKTTGRGKDFAPLLNSEKNIERLFQRAQVLADDQCRYERNPWRLSCDTAFVDQYEHVMDQHGIPKFLRSSPEGQFSCYIDAVENTIAPSSYCDASEYAPRQEGNLVEQFARFGKPMPPSHTEQERKL